MCQNKDEQTRTDVKITRQLWPLPHVLWPITGITRQAFTGSNLPTLCVCVCFFVPPFMRVCIHVHYPSPEQAVCTPVFTRSRCLAPPDVQRLTVANPRHMLTANSSHHHYPWPSYRVHRRRCHVTTFSQVKALVFHRRCLDKGSWGICS